MSAAGMIHQDIADATNLSRPTITKLLHKPELQEKINTVRDKLLNDLLPKACENVEFCVNGMQTTDDKQFKYFGYRASEKIMESVGLLASPALSIQFQQIFNHQQIHLHPVISGLLGSHGGTFDAEFTDGEGSEE
jgi:hypothetical protein